MTTTFADLGLPEPLVRALASRGFTEPFPVQAAAIPDALDGLDVSGKAPTGSGKTLAFGLPLLANVEVADSKKPRALILAPTRELAEQIKDELAPLANKTYRNVFAVYGGVGYQPQKTALRKGVDILVATPGRLEDLLEQKTLTLSQVDLVVIDEADRMADMGFMPAVRRILDQTAKKRQTLLFSATLDGDIAVLSRDYQNSPVRHDAPSIEPETSEARHHFWLVEHHDRVQHTAEVVESAGRTIVFTRTRHGADRVARQLGKLGTSAVAMHGGRSQAQRKRALRDFTTGRVDALVATDVAARGIHVDDVATVIHFDPANDHKDYLHRSGRTARAGAAGTVVSLVTGAQRRVVKRMQKQLDLDMPIGEARVDDLHNGGRVIRPAKQKRRPESERRERKSRHSDEVTEERAPSRRRHHAGEPQGRDGATIDKSGRRDKRPSTKADRNDKRSTSRTESIYVANLPWGATEDEIAELFSRHGEVEQTTIIRNRNSGRSKGFAFVDMPRTSARIAVGALHGAHLGGRELTVRVAKPRRN
jgi:superfamily II DNA/RNA helicase